MTAPTDKPIIFFDGYCGLCSEFVDFVMKVDQQGVHMFTPLQGKTAEELLNPQERQDLDSVIVYQNGRKLKRSEAVFQVLRNVGGVWTILSWFSLLPPALTDVGYNLVAKYRYKIFGKKESCRLPTSLERKRFLD